MKKTKQLNILITESDFELIAKLSSHLKISKVEIVSQSVQYFANSKIDSSGFGFDPGDIPQSLPHFRDLPATITGDLIRDGWIKSGIVKVDLGEHHPGTYELIEGKPCYVLKRNGYREFISFDEIATVIESANAKQKRKAELCRLFGLCR